MKNLLGALAGMLCLTGALQAQDKVIIKGTVNGDIQGHKEVYVYGKDIKYDTAVIENGHFEFSIPYKKDMMPLLYDQYDMIVKKGVSPFPVVIDGPGVVYLKDVDIAKGLQSGTLSGMKATEDYQAYVNQSHKIESEIRSLLKKKYGDSLTPKSPAFKAYIEEMEALNKERSIPLVEKTIQSDPDAYIAAFVLATDGRELLSIEELEKMYKTLSAKRQQSEYGKTVGDYIAGIKNSAIGQKAKNFSLNTPEGKPLSLEGLKGKYLVLDFWASWCGPCIKSFPHMKEIYKKYKGDHFEVLSVSIDQSKADWLKALKTQQLPWLQVLDTKKVALKNFGVTAIPTVYLIDPDGKIVAKEMGFEPDGKGAIESKLVEALGSK